MDRPISLIGNTVGGAFICSDWELRITGRCLEEDLNASAEADFEAVRGLEIVKAFVGECAEKANGTRQVSPLRCGQEIWVLARGNDHRGATLHRPDQQVLWLLAYARHRSGQSDDFFPFCKELDKQERLLPTKDDYKRMVVERDRRFVDAVRVEAPLILREARSCEGEYRCTAGGSLGASVSVEFDGELDATAITVAFQANEIEYEQALVLLAALTPSAWEPIQRMPSRELVPGEVAFTVMFSSGQPV